MRTGARRALSIFGFRQLAAALIALAFCAAGGRAAAQDDKEEKEKGASLSLKASPAIAFAPVRIVVTAELRGGEAESAELYCPGLEWDWGDGTTSEANVDCAPYEPGKTEIRRRWTTSHTYRTGGNYRVQLRLKRGDKTVVSGAANVRIRGGFREPDF